MPIIKTIRSWFVKEKPKEIIEYCWNDCPICSKWLITSLTTSRVVNTSLRCKTCLYCADKHHDMLVIGPYCITRFSYGETEIWFQAKEETDDIIIDLSYILPFKSFSSVEKIERLLMLL